MTQSTNHQAKPSHGAYVLKESAKGGKCFWTRIGSAWTHNDTKGLNIQLECVPLDGRITLRLNEEKPN